MDNPSAVDLSLVCGIYAEVPRFHQRMINHRSNQRTTTQIAAPPQSLPQTAVPRAETPKAKAIKNPKNAPLRARNPISWCPLSRATPEANSWPPTDFHPGPVATTNVIIAIRIPFSSYSLLGIWINRADLAVHVGYRCPNHCEAASSSKNLAASPDCSST